ncbi:hypothetical protein GE09DRAFT_1078164 [Coniochaeta sp. 2T2.1]|nr:hypothetical protein GE09DRAFT_1078164 [Coniochaeta sp. 2T2.1]
MRITVLESLTRALSSFPVFQKALSGGSPIEASYAAAPLKEVPGGTPLSFCEVSRPTDLFNISMVQIDQLPKPVHIDDVFYFYLYGTFQDTIPANATINITVDCGSHCEENDLPPGSGESFTLDLCEFSWIEQPLGGMRKSPICPPEQGPGLITHIGYVWPMFINFPVSCRLLLFVRPIVANRAKGWYNFTFDAKTAEGERIYCLTSEVCLKWERDEVNDSYPKGPWSNCTWPR